MSSTTGPVWPSGAGEDLGSYDPPALLPRVVARWWVIGVVTFFAVGCAVLYCVVATPQYRAEAQVELSSGAASLVVGPNLIPNVDDKRRYATETSILLSDRVHDAAEEIAGRKLPDVEVTQDASSDILGISVVDPSATHAADDANAYVQAYLGISRDNTDRQLQPVLESMRADLATTNGSITSLQKQLALHAVTPSSSGLVSQALQARINNALSQRLALSQSIESISSALSLGSLDARPFADAAVPEEPTYPQKARTIAVTGALSLVLSGLIAAAVPLRPRTPRGPRTPRAPRAPRGTGESRATRPRRTRKVST